MHPELIERQHTAAEAARLLALSCGADAARVARDLMHLYRQNQEARSYWCEVVYIVEKTS